MPLEPSRQTISQSMCAFLRRHTSIESGFLRRTEIRVFCLTIYRVVIDGYIVSYGLTEIGLPIG